MPANNTAIEKRLWDAADELRANSRLKPSEYSVPVLGLIFLRYADHKFAHAEQEIKTERAVHAGRRRQRPITRDDYHARGVLYLPDEARFQRLVELPEGENIGSRLHEAMKGIEAENPDLKDVLPKTYNRLGNATLVSLLKIFYEGELAVFDILTRPGPDLSEKEKRATKRIARALLTTLSREKLVLDWRKRQQSRAAVRVAIEDVIWRLPKCFTKEMCRQKSTQVYQHVYDNYWGAGQSVYAVAG